MIGYKKITLSWYFNAMGWRKNPPGLAYLFFKRWRKSKLKHTLSDFWEFFFYKNIAMITLLFDRKWEHASLKLQGLRFFSCRLVEVNISHQSLVQHDKLFLWVSQNYTENNFDLVNKWVISKEKFVRDSSPPPPPIESGGIFKKSRGPPPPWKWAFLPHSVD